jgi:hypothetical protein
MPWRGATEPGEFPTLGYTVGEWMEASLVVPDREAAGQPYLLTDEMWRFLLDLYRVDPETGEYVFYGAQLRRPQKWGKDPFGGGIALAESLADVVFDGWDASGEPVGRPRATPLVQCLGVSEEQTDNTFRPILEMIVRGPLVNLPGMDAGETRINLPGGGRIEPVTSSSRSRLGARITFATMTETHLWTPASGGRTLASAVRRNLAGMDGRWLELTNAYDPAEQSVAQATAEAHADGVLVDDRPGKHVDLDDDEALRREVVRVYGDSAREAGGWVNTDRIIAEIRDAATLEPDARRFFLNQVVAGALKFIDPIAWDGAARTDEPLKPGEKIALGFDGSKTDDATALIASRLSDGRLFHLRTWERPAGAAADWRVPGAEVDRVLTETFTAYEVAMMFADPWKWQDYLDVWAARWPALVMEFPTNQYVRMDKALERFTTAFASGEITHDGDLTLGRHVKNAVLSKAAQKRSRHDDDSSGTHYLRLSKRRAGLKIDAAVAAVLAHAARAHAIENGALQVRSNAGWFVAL